MRAEWWNESEPTLVDRQGGPRPLFRHCTRDAWLLGAWATQVLSLGLVLWAANSLAEAGPLSLWANFGAALVFGVSSVWCSNTVSHIHLHTPLFRSARLNRTLTLLLTLSLGIPQSLWRARHRWHHAGEPPARKPTLLGNTSRLEASLVLLLWLGMALLSPSLFVWVYLPGYILGMALAWLTGEMEHLPGPNPERGISTYGGLHNRLWFNDGYHAEHHLHPTLHWTKLPARRGEAHFRTSPYSPLLRAVPFWFGRLPSFRAILLGWLEHLALNSRVIQRFMVKSHQRAIEKVLATVELKPQRIGIVGGGLFPRTALVMSKLFPNAELTIIDGDEKNVGRARLLLAARDLKNPTIHYKIRPFRQEMDDGYDLLIAPLAFVGDRRELNAVSKSSALLTHDWIWHNRGQRRQTVSWLLLKQVSLALPRITDASSS